ncbi:tRNA 2-selenouridine(34) synthase MnmH [Paenibacillus sp. 1001270B_150601_E10]|uniref:tRNA 2-selenouridine(34) synthase MnmH n=1 Tax=Paenibacillus sp. 1001270B_150601_E10 TaxID=2787079 RepID=UPI00189F19F8|nr:tRNA 2-selenouridine(34) synthase MnmH [Paenibacillus sp. 1001270B_150601_E10]
MRDISLEEVLHYREQGATLVDVRSPGEYEEFTIPGSINIPLFSNEERSEIGTIYKQVSVDRAKERGLEIASQKLPELYRQFKSLQGPIILYCWRGGMRSRTMATVMSLMGMTIYRLQGGIRSYRRFIQEQVQQEWSTPVIVLSGYTGTGKTAILQYLEEQGYPIMDIERMAGHRGSIFGHIGLHPSSQKMFDAIYVEQKQSIEKQQKPLVLMEAESRRVGKVVLPEALMEAKNKGKVLHIELPIEERVKVIMEDYSPALHEEAIRQAFERIRRRLHTPIAQELAGLLEQKHYEKVIQLMMEYYYDPRYEHAALTYEGEAVLIQAATLEEAKEQVELHVQQMLQA